jgi:lysophospholipase L1-like esterase
MSRALSQRPTLQSAAEKGSYAPIAEARRNGVFQNRKNSAAAAGDLTIAYLQSTTSALTSPVSIDGNVLTTFRYSACGVGVPAIPAGGSWMGPRARSASGGDNWGSNVVDFNVNSADFEYQYQFVQGTTGYLRVFVDDQLVSTWSGAYVANQYWVMRITAPARRTMHVRIETNMGTRRVYIGQNDQAWTPKKPLYKSRWYFKGDSWTAGAQDATGRAYLMPLAERLRVEPLRGGYSATGYTTDGGGASGKLTFPAAVSADIVPQAPNVVMIFGSINDSSNVAGLQAAAKTTYDNLAAQLPGVPVIVVGPQYGMYSGPSSALCDSMETALNAAIAQCPNVIGFISTKGWVTGNGKVDVASTSNPKGNCEFVTATDGIHPTQLGHEWVADRLYEEITALLANRIIPTSAV